jgi:hypothetical protein
VSIVLENFFNKKHPINPPNKYVTLNVLTKIDKGAEACPIIRRYKIE